MLSLSDLSGNATKCTLLDVSERGVALNVAAPDFNPEPGDWLTIHMDTYGKRVEIPGRVRYAVNTGLNRVFAGVELDLDSSGASTQKSWSFWVQSLIATMPATMTATSLR